MQKETEIDRKEYIEMSVTLETISALDWIILTDIEDAESCAEMEVVNVAEMLIGEDETGLFLLVSDTDGNLVDDEDEEAEEVESEDVDAYIFKVCGEEDAEFTITEKNNDEVIFVTTNFPEEEYTNAANLFVETSADYDIEIE